MNYHDVMEVYKRPMALEFIPRLFGWITVFVLLFGASQTAYAETLWVQVPQWSDDWSKCAVDVPDASCHWYIVNADNTFGEGFSWENAPWFSASGLLDVKSNVVEGLQKVG